LKKKVLALSLVLALLFSITTGLLFVNFSATAFIPGPVILPSITITNDGSISPYTELIKRNGNTYTLTDNVIEYPIIIERSNIVFDGAGYNITVAKGDNPGLFLRGIYDPKNVIVKNVNVFSKNIYTIEFRCSKGLIENVITNKDIRITGDSNTITKSVMKVCIVKGSNNLITQNNITDILVDSYSYSNKFFENNFLLTDFLHLFRESVWDNGSVGNYWSDYQSKYPNASEIGNTGIGDTSYIIDSDNVDRYPLMYPWGTPEITVFGLENTTYSGGISLNFSVSKSTVWMGYSLDGGDNVTVAGNLTLNGLATGFHNLTVYANDSFENVVASETITFAVISEPFPVVPIVAVSVVAISLLAAGLLIYHKKHKHNLVKKLRIKLLAVVNQKRRN